MNHVILLPSGEGIRNQLISVIDFLLFFSFFYFFFCPPLKISLCFASICGMKSVITVLKALGWDLQLLFLPCGKLCLELLLPEWCQPWLNQNSESWQGWDVAGQRISPLSSEICVSPPHQGVCGACVNMRNQPVP